MSRNFPHRDLALTALLATRVSLHFFAKIFSPNATFAAEPERQNPTTISTETSQKNPEKSFEKNSEKLPEKNDEKPRLNSDDLADLHAQNSRRQKIIKISHTNSHKNPRINFFVADSPDPNDKFARSRTAEIRARDPQRTTLPTETRTRLETLGALRAGDFSAAANFSKNLSRPQRNNFFDARLADRAANETKPDYFFDAQLARQLLLLDQPQLAKKIALGATLANPDYSLPHQILAAANRTQKNFDDAARSFATLRRLQPEARDQRARREAQSHAAAQNRKSVLRAMQNLETFSDNDRRLLADAARNLDEIRNFEIARQNLLPTATTGDLDHIFHQKLLLPRRLDDEIPLTSETIALTLLSCQQKVSEKKFSPDTCRPREIFLHLSHGQPSRADAILDQRAGDRREDLIRTRLHPDNPQSEKILESYRRRAQSQPELAPFFPLK